MKKDSYFNQIEYVDIWETFATRNLHVFVKGQESVFTANVFNRRNLERVLGFLEYRGVHMHQRAKAYVSENVV